MTLTTQAQIAAMEGTVGQAAAHGLPRRLAADRRRRRPARRRRGGPISAGHQEHFWAGLTTLAAILLLLSGGYRRLERITTVLVAAVTLFTVASVLILQLTTFPHHLADLGSGFELAVPAAAVALAFSAFGITGVGASELVAYPYWCIEKGYARYAGARSEDPGWAHGARGLDPRDAARRLVQHGGLHRGDGGVLLPRGGRACIPQGLDPKGPEMIPTLSRMYLQPLEGTSAGLDARHSPGSASCWGPGPSCSRRCTSPRRPTAG